MKSHCASTTRRRSTARVSISRAAVLMTIALGLALASGCAQSAPPPPNLSATPALSTETAAVTRAGSSSSRHDRIMTEQGRRTGTAAAGASSTTTSIGPAQSALTTTGVPTVQSDSSTTVILTQGLTPLRGVWRGTAERLAAFLVGASPSPRFTVPASVLAEYYVRYCAEAGLRADLLWAQMIHETGYGMYGGDVLPEQNNYTGIGATGGDEPGASFPTAEAGVMAHVAHMVAYVYASTPVSWADASTDPRFRLVIPRGAASTLADLNGRWAVPGTTYGESIEEIARAINAGS